jgi:hypothetical protein
MIAQGICGTKINSIDRERVDAVTLLTGDPVQECSGFQIRARWPKVCTLLRADGGFARDNLMVGCEERRVDYLFG